jgi:hypothetical protein
MAFPWTGMQSQALSEGDGTMMNRIPAEPSKLRGIGFGPDQKIPELERRGNAVWQTRDVPMNIRLEPESAPSNGKIVSLRSGNALFPRAVVSTEREAV